MIDGKELSRKMTEYLTLSKKRTINAQNSVKELYQEIHQMLMCYFYFEPIKNQLLDEEEAAEFVLYMMEKLDGFLLNYRPKEMDFYRYLNHLITFKIKTFKFKIKSENQKRTLIETNPDVDFGYWENFGMVSEQVPTHTFAPERSDNLFIARMKYIFLKNPKTRKRFFIYLMAISPSLSYSTIQEITSIFNISFHETLSITNLLRGMLNLENKNSEERRNYYWSRVLVLEKDMQRKAFLEAPKKELHELSYKIERHRNRLQKRNLEIEKKQNRVPYLAISRLFSVPRGTVSSAIHFSKEYIKICDNPAKGKMILEFDPITANELCNDDYVLEVTKKTELPFFFPYGTFSLNDELKIVNP